jgi:hypothetical protein
MPQPNDHLSAGKDLIRRLRDLVATVARQRRALERAEAQLQTLRERIARHEAGDKKR